MSPLPRAKQFYFTHEKKHIFFPKLTQLLCVPFILTPVLKYSRQRLLLFSTINLLVRFQAEALLQLDLYLSTLFFPFCYRLVRTYVREHISVFNKNDRRNLFLSAHIIFSVGMLLTKHPNGWKFCGIMVRAAFWQIRASDKINKNHFVCLLACFAFQSWNFASIEVLPEGNQTTSSLDFVQCVYSSFFIDMIHSELTIQSKLTKISYGEFYSFTWTSANHIFIDEI